MRRRALFLLGALAVACSGSPTAPVVIPLPAGTNAAPIIHSISVPASRIEANVNVTITAAVQDAETALAELTFTWAASAGTITGNGLTATYRHAPGLKKGVDVIVTLTVVEEVKIKVNGEVVRGTLQTVRQAAPFRVHDSDAEMKELARKFLIDLFGNSTVSPEACLVDFSEVGRCATGKAAELGDIRTHRQDCVVFDRRIHSQRVDYTSASTAVVHNDAEFIDVCASADQPAVLTALDIRTDFFLTTIYDSNRWWLCESSYVPTDQSSLHAWR